MEDGFWLEITFTWGGVYVISNVVLTLVLAIYTTIWILYEYDYLDKNWGNVFFYNFNRALNNIHYYNILSDLVYVWYM